MTACSSLASRAALLAETEEMCGLARSIGCPAIQLLTGPLDPAGSYREPFELDARDLDRETAANLRQIGAIGHQFGVGFYIEPLAWTPLANLERMLHILDDAAQD